MFLNFEQLIDLLPQIIIYFLPGYVFIYFKNYLFSNDINDDDNIIIKSIISSYIIINIFLFITNISRIKVNSVKDIVGNDFMILVIICFAFLLGYLYFIIVKSERWHTIIQNIGINKTTYSTIWEDIIDSNIGPHVRIYLDDYNIFYQGKINIIEDNGKDNYFISLSNFIKYKNGKMIESYEYDDNKIVVINTNKITRYEIFK